MRTGEDFYLGDDGITLFLGQPAKSSGWAMSESRSDSESGRRLSAAKASINEADSLGVAY